MRKTEDQRRLPTAGRPRDEAVDDRLELLEGRARGLRGDAVLGDRVRAQLRRREHRDAVATVSRQRDGDEDVLRAVGRLRKEAQAVALGLRPLDLHVAEHVLLRERVALEAQAEPAAHRAVRPVAADQVARPHPAVVEHGGHAVGVLLEGPQLARALHAAAEPLEPAEEQALDPVLRKGEEAKRAVGHREVDALGLLAVDVDDLPPHPPAVVDRLAGDAQVVPDLERARLDADRLDQPGRLGEAVDDAAADAVAEQLGRHRQADRAGAGHEDVGVGHGAILLGPPPAGQAR